ncbi:MAG TPA: 3'(2'),5'-bisphosphate nucleotidase CysQ [Polyangiaceae bacterium]|nr:3'(2'),5'-bisphosphate nucleotidase CysQ [Polyangiaceae bacterium]
MSGPGAVAPATLAALADRGALLAALCELVERAGRVVLEVYGTDFAVDDKAPGDHVTEADRRANGLLCRALAERFPGVPVVAEESDPASYAGFAGAPAAFFVDPLDGTREFVARNGEFVVMVGLAERGRAAAGAVHAPTRGLSWAGAPGFGAYARDRAGGTRPIAVGDAAEASAARLVVSRSRRGERLERALAAFGPREARPLGSAGLKGAAVAAGEADAYVQVGPAGSLWDLCAPEALVRGAGGRVSDERGAPLSYAREGLAHESGLVVSNGRLHDALVAAVGRAG